MSRNYYILSNGRLQRENNTLSVINEHGVKKPIPVEDVESLYLYGEVDINTKLLNFLTQKKLTLHVFNYYGFYSGSFYPREYLHSGYLLVKQVERYGDSVKRLDLAKELVRGAAHSILRNVAYYSRRKGNRDRLGSDFDSDYDDDADPIGEIMSPAASTALSSPQVPSPAARRMEGGGAGEVGEGDASVGRVREKPIVTPQSGVPTDEESEIAVDNVVLSATAILLSEASDPLSSEIDFDAVPTPLEELRATITGIVPLIETQLDVNSVRGVEGKIRERYYQSWRHILAEGFYFTSRVRRPPDNEVNALISFGNSMLYTVCLSEIYRTQLTPTISYLHEPGVRRFSLALDLSEIFKPLIVDRAIFRLINTGQLKPEHFDRSLDSCYLSETGRKLYITALEERLGTTIKHRRLGRHVTYRHLIRLECYKLIRDLTGVEPYKAFRAWW